MAQDSELAARMFLRSMEHLAQHWADSLRPALLQLHTAAAGMTEALAPISRAMAELEGLDLTMPDAARHLPDDPEW